MIAISVSVIAVTVVIVAVVTIPVVEIVVIVAVVVVAIVVVAIVAIIIGLLATDRDGEHVRIGVIKREFDTSGKRAMVADRRGNLLLIAGIECAVRLVKVDLDEMAIGLPIDAILAIG